MSLAVLDNVALGFGKKTVVEALSMRIAHDDRIGLIGPNGSGKTSLLRLLAGEQAPDYGAITLSQGVRLGYLPQDIAVHEDKPLLRFVMESVKGRAALDRELAGCEAALHEREQDPGDGEVLMSLAEKLADLHERIAHYDMHYTEHAARRILHGLGFEAADETAALGALSGGWKMRAVLASLLFQKPDLLLLDEPTNHLDLPSVTWLSDFLRGYDRAFILICHDREFLNEQVERIVSFEVEGVRQYAGNYERYLALRREEEIILSNKAKNLGREREQAERFINRFRAQANKARAVQSRVKALDRMEDVETYQKHKVMRLRFPPTERAVTEPLRLQGLGKSYGDKVVLRGVSLQVGRGDRIGIIGRNGAGKTTLLRLLAGELQPSSGEIVVGSNVQVGYYAQHHAELLHRDSTIYQEVSRWGETASVTRVRSVLGAFLFSDDDVEKKIGVLSGGERARVALARLLIKPGNLLLMDEPTNHLDLASAETLAESLQSYDGTLLFVSHNRAFVRRLSTRIWNVDGGTVEAYPGTLDEYMDSCRRREQAAAGAAQPARPAAQPAPRGAAKPASPKPADHEPRSKNRRQKLTREVSELEAKIGELEAAQRSRGEALADPAVYADKARSGELIAAHGKAQAELERLTQRWERALTELQAAGGPLRE